MEKSELDFSGKWKNKNFSGKSAYPTIFIFRHAQTYYNKNKFFTGWKDSKLTPLGVRQAKIVADKLKNKKIDIAFSTSLSRSKDTLRAVLKKHPECKHVFMDDRMIERSYGKFQGTSHKSYEKKFGAEQLYKLRRSYTYISPGGENLKMVGKRVNAFLKDLIAYMKRNKVNVAISAHGNSMRPFRKYFEKLSIAQMMKLENPWDNYFEYRIKV